MWHVSSRSGEATLQVAIHLLLKYLHEPTCGQMDGQTHRQTVILTITMARLVNNFVWLNVWPGGVMVRVLARDMKGRGFDSRPFHFQVTTLGKLFTHTCLCYQAV